jgi:hypothetical protein
MKKYKLCWHASPFTWIGWWVPGAREYDDADKEPIPIYRCRRCRCRVVVGDDLLGIQRSENLSEYYYKPNDLLVII